MLDRVAFMLLFVVVSECTKWSVTFSCVLFARLFFPFFRSLVVLMILAHIIVVYLIVIQVLDNLKNFFLILKKMF